MRRNAILPALPLLLLTLSGCGGTWHATPEADLEGNGVGSTSGATVVTGQELHEINGSVLRALMGKVPNLKVDFGVERCPAISLRRAKDLYGYNYPEVYVDGTRAGNTCILESFPASDVDRVEIYPQGFTTRPGYTTSTHGLILLFTRTG